MRKVGDEVGEVDGDGDGDVDCEVEEWRLKSGG